jgi:NADH-quinone oxidoreductase subunit H
MNGDFWFSDNLGWLDAILRVLIIVGAMTLTVLALIYFEQKLLARIQMRIGPMRTGPYGMLQTAADALKLIGKEDLRPKGADRWVFNMAPYVVFVPVFLSLLVLPFAEDWGVRSLPLGMFFVIAMLSINIVGTLMAGFGSDNKYALLGGVRAAAQMISYEIPLVLSILAVAMVAGSMNLNAVVGDQGQIPYVLLQPMGFLIFLTATLSELHRAPFDIPVAEGEVVGGYFVEYSGMRWSIFFLAEYASLWLFSIFGSAIFLGGWAWPLGEEWGWPWQLALTFIKSFILIVLVIWIRATVPRLRIDQLMSFAWKVLLPLAFVQVLVNGAVLVYGGDDWILAVTSAVGALFLAYIVYWRLGKKHVRRPTGVYANPREVTPLGAGAPPASG